MAAQVDYPVGRRRQLGGDANLLNYAIAGIQSTIGDLAAFLVLADEDLGVLQ